MRFSRRRGKSAKLIVVTVSLLDLLMVWRRAKIKNNATHLRKSYRAPEQPRPGGQYADNEDEAIWRLLPVAEHPPRK